MEKFTITNNEAAQYIGITPVKPQVAFYIKEDSAMYRLADYNFDGSSNLSATQTVDPIGETLFAGINKIPLGSYSLPTDYIGATTIDVPHFILEQYATFKLYDMQTNAPGGLVGGSVETSNVSNLFDATDTDLKVTTVANGLQFLRIPVNRFNTLDADGIVIAKNFGKYYVMVSPKYIQASVVSIQGRDQGAWEDIATMAGNGQAFGKRRKTYEINKNNFFGTPWSFESSARQAGRLYGSVTEVWDASGTFLKQTLVVNEDQMAFNSPATTGFVGLHPELVGYDAVTQAVAPGDLLRIYPRETYFKPIFIELSYDASNNLNDLVRFMMNDVVQDTTRGIYEVYDENGVTTDGQGNISGTVVLSYQISQEGKYQIRRRSTLPDGTGNTLQSGL